MVLQTICKAQSIGVGPGGEGRALGSRGCVQTQRLVPGVSSEGWWALQCLGLQPGAGLGTS